MTKNQYIANATEVIENHADIYDALEAIAEQNFTERDYALWDDGKLTKSVSEFLAAVRDAAGDPNAYIELFSDNVSSKKVVVCH